MQLKSVSTFAMYQQRSDNVRRLEADLARTSHETSSGRKADIARDLGAGVGDAFAARGELETTDAYLQSVETFARRAEVMAAALVQADETVNGLIETAVLNIPDPGGSVSALPQAAEAMIAALGDTINSPVDGRFMFSGVDYGAAPFGRIDEPAAASGLSPRQAIEEVLSGAAYAPAQPPAFAAYDAAEAADAVARFDAMFDGTNAGAGAPLDAYSFEQSFYAGDVGGPMLSARLSEAASVEYGVRGDDAAFRNIMQGAYMLATADMDALSGTEAYTPFVEAALERLTEGLTTLREQTGALGGAQQQAARIEEALTARKALIEKAVIDAEQVDPIESQARFQEIEKQLEAAYSATVRVTRLRLSNYL